MVNFPSLLVSEEEQEAGPEMPGGSTVHSWINADFVPSWLRPFTLDANTRFTRTPDHLLRPPEEAAPHAEGFPPTDEPLPAGEPMVLPSFGTTGASWHFLEMPLDLEQEAPAVPSVRADREALEQALADLPALRAARDGARTTGEADSGEEAGPEGWSMDERGVETVLPWSAPADEMPEGMGEMVLDPHQELPAQGLSSPNAWAPEPPEEAFAWPAESIAAEAPPAGPLAAPMADAGEEVAPLEAMAPPQPFVTEVSPVDTGFSGSVPWVAAPSQDAVIAAVEASSWPAEPSQDGPAVGFGPADMPPVVDGLEMLETADEVTSATRAFEAGETGWPAMGGLELPAQADAAPVLPSGEISFQPDAAFDGSARTDFAATDAGGPVLASWEAPSGSLAVDESLEGGAEAVEALPAFAEPLDAMSLPASSAGIAEAVTFDALPDLLAGPESGVSSEPATMAVASEPQDELAAAQPDVLPAEGQPAVCFDDAAVALEDHGIVVDENGLDGIEAGADLVDGFESGFEAGEIEVPAADVLMDGVDVAAVAAEAGVLAGMAASTDLAGDLEALGDVALGEMELAETTLAEADMAGALTPVTGIEERAPAHLQVLTRLIVVGRLPLPVVAGQDLLPPEPQPEAAEAAAVTPSASLVHAHFAWQPYHLSINGEASEPAEAPVADEDATAQEPARPEAAAQFVDEAPADGADAVELDEIAFGYHLPPLDLLREPPHVEPDFELSAEFLDQSSVMLQQIVRDFGVRGEVIDANPGPVVTLYEFEPAPGVKSSRVIALAADIARSMSAVSARVAVVEGRNVIGIELPNRRRETVWLRELLSSHEFEEARTKLGLCLGKTIGGVPVIADLARMPHLLVAGTTGSGKSVAINTMILSLLYRHTPDACRLIMIDPKMLELSVYEGIPHLLTPVVTDPKKAIIALKWAVKEMEDRYRKMARLAVRNIDGYNARMAEAREKNEVITRQVQVGFDKESGEALYEEQEMDLTALPYIVIIVDEMADLMMVAGKEIEGAIQRLAQMARAAGIHLVMATQRPSVDVITGTIKANFPTRISFQVTSKIDSRTILGEMGAETLLGQGDMLFMAGGGRITRVHGPFVSDQEVEHVVAFLKAQGGPEYLEDVVQDEEADGPAGADDAVFDKSELGDSGGDLYEQAVAIVMRDRKASTSYIQRRLQVGYNKAASLMERMQNEGIVGPANHAGKREILTFSRPD